MKKLLLILLAVIIAVLAVSVYGNSRPELTVYTERFSSLPEGFDGFRILQVSDLHDALMGEDNCRVTALARNARPDIIVITGDIIDKNRLNTERSVRLARDLAGIAPVYYVNGNHEAALRRNDYNALISGLKGAGVTVLSDSAVYLERNGSVIQLAGLADIGFSYRGNMQETLSGLLERAAFAIDDDAFTVLLSHRPELIETYARTTADLVLCGHAHGGQIRLPFIGGLYSPGQGLFPKYAGGVYSCGRIRMAVSRGIGNSTFPLRILNNPELVLIQLTK